MLRILSVFLFCLGIFCLAQSNAQVPMTGAGLGAPPSGSSYVGPGNVQSNLLTYWGTNAVTGAHAGNKALNVCNSGDANCADVNTLSGGDFDVATAQGSPLNCAGAGGTCTAKTIYDQIGTNCAGPCDFTQAIAADRWVLKFNCFGGAKACLSNSSTTATGYVVSAPTITQLQPYGMLCAISVVSGKVNPNMLVQDDGTVSGPYFGGHSTPTMQWQVGASSFTIAISFSTPYTVIALASGASSNFWLNGSSTTGTVGTGAMASTYSLYFGNDPFGDIYTADVGGCAWIGADPTANVTALTSNIRTYWGF